MSNCVIRFGGSSLSKLSVLEAFAGLLASPNDNSTVVVSAVPEIEQTIEEGIELLVGNAGTSGSVISKVRHIVNERLNIFGQTEHDSILSGELDNLENLLTGIEFTGDFSVMLKDQVISCSERITAVILHIFLSKRLIDSNLVFPEDIGLFVSEEYGNASILYNKSEQLAQKLPQGINLVAGSYGITQCGKIARLGKRSADYSAAAITLLTKANSLQLWEIDNPFYTTDADYVENKKPIPQLDYNEASELSYFSGKSIHPRIVEPLMKEQIPIHIFELANNEKKLVTTISHNSFISPKVVKSVVHTKDVAILQLNGPGVGFKPGILAEITSTFHKSGINIRSVITSQTSINIILSETEILKAFEICCDLQLNSVNDILFNCETTLIAIVGYGMQHRQGVSAKLFKAVSKHQINVELSGSGASDISSYIVVSESDTQTAITEIHEIFFGDK